MESLSLTPATQVVLDALTELGRGNVHELAAKSGKARSTTDKAIKTLADAGVIVAVDGDTDPADGTPTQWTLAPRADDSDTAPDDVDLGDEHTGITDEADFGDPDVDDATDEPDTGDTDDTERTDQPEDGEGGAIPDDAGADTEDEAGQTEDGDEDAVDVDSTRDDESHTLTVVQATRPGDRKVMAIKGVLADYGDDGATLDVIVAESGIGHLTATRLLTAMEQADAARRLPGAPQRWIPGPTKASDVDPNPEPPRCPLCHQVIRRLANTPSATAAVLPLIRPDGTLHVVGPDGEIHVLTLPTRTRLTGVARSGGRRGDGTVNTDGSQPFGRGELEKLTLDVLAANPVRAMTPQDIATAIGGQLDRTVSSGAVRNNCTKAAAAGRILLVSDTPLTFAYPEPPDNGDTAEQS
ncbi:helix-turn-helix domain-containing protein [Micromonospora chersina]|uniref:helix-turn-helix domain-containing protein n=1 Tax=Micromonospora chersina TaxID=47854 RepID=UPI0033C8FB3C